MTCKDRNQFRGFLNFNISNMVQRLMCEWSVYKYKPKLPRLFIGKDKHKKLSQHVWLKSKLPYKKLKCKSSIECWRHNLCLCICDCVTLYKSIFCLRQYTKKEKQKGNLMSSLVLMAKLEWLLKVCKIQRWWINTLCFAFITIQQFQQLSCFLLGTLSTTYLQQNK